MSWPLTNPKHVDVPQCCRCGEPQRYFEEIGTFSCDCPKGEKNMHVMKVDRQTMRILSRLETDKGKIARTLYIVESTHQLDVFVMIDAIRNFSHFSEIEGAIIMETSNTKHDIKIQEEAFNG